MIVGFALVGWCLCAATMGIGIAAFGLQVALVVHAVAAPVIFAAVSLLYFKHLGYTTPLTTAAVFLAVVVIMDVGVVSMLVQRSFEMFTSFLGTWLPFMLIFASTYLVGAIARSRRRN
ncbi:MAG TPA: hypothetical protein VMV04_24795 [Thermodesulfobacteriota bacterium]|nr:hypothetical protein [Thermodesulfobacteriota bacterium]